jgi:glycosyltransferase involved in cell wall biosynthesis
MGYLSGSCLYVYELARELAKTNDVTVLSDWTVIGSDGEKLKKGLKGVKCISYMRGEYDVVIASQFCPEVTCPVINVVHSEYDVETPIKADAYIAIRPSIRDHIVNEHGIDPDKVFVIYNGVDLERFKPMDKPKRDFKLTVVPCTIDPLREKFINHLCSISSKDNVYMFFGDYYNAKINKTPYTLFYPAKFHIEEIIAKADEVAGILYGRINIEAMACDTPSLMFDPDTLKVEKFKCEKFHKQHDIVNVAREILDLIKCVC